MKDDLVGAALGRTDESGRDRDPELVAGEGATAVGSSEEPEVG
jgi:hypothetical protein